IRVCYYVCLPHVRAELWNTQRNQCPCLSPTERWDHLSESGINAEHSVLPLIERERAAPPITGEGPRSDCRGQGCLIRIRNGLVKLDHSDECAQPPRTPFAAGASREL